MEAREAISCIEIINSGLFVAEEFHFVNPSFNVIRLCGHGKNYGGDLLVQTCGEGSRGSEVHPQPWPL